MDFHIFYFKRNAKVWTINDQDSKEACETLNKVGKLTLGLWCIGTKKCGSERGQSSTESGSKDEIYRQYKTKSDVITLKNEVHGSKK